MMDMADIRLTNAVQIDNSNMMMMMPMPINLECSSRIINYAEICEHPIVYGGICDQLLVDDESAGIALNYVAKGLRISEDEIARIRHIELQNLLGRKKLCLVLDLDNTLLHTTHIDTLSPEEEYLKQSDCLEGNLLIWQPMITKLRPFVREFLEEASRLFELYIYTMGDRNYALRMAEFLDPEDVYFNSKVISREDSTKKHQKGLDVVPVHESAVLILDDRESVWKRNSDNLILMDKYKYFASRGNENGSKCRSFSEQRIDESEAEGALSSVLKVLKRIHCVFFWRLNFLHRDVRKLLEFVRRNVLKGCKLVLGQGAITSTTGYCQLWRMAEEMGATCSGECCSLSVTHVVSTDANTGEARWAVMEDKFLVNPKWITAAYYLWKRQPEEEFRVNQMDSCEGNGNAGGQEQTGSETISSGLGCLGLGKRSRSDDESTSQGLGKRQRSWTIVL